MDTSNIHNKSDLQASPFRGRLEGAYYYEVCSSAEHPYLAALYRATQVMLLRPRMASGHHQGLLLKTLVQISGARRIVEIGTYSGYSALAMASGINTEEGPGKLVTFEINDEQEDFTRPWIEGSPWAESVEMVIGDALEIIPQREDIRDIDLCFIDANKRHYQAYLDMMLPLMRPGGLIICDNTLWDGHLTDPTYHDPQTEALRRFNADLAARTDLNVILLPIRDGLTLIVRPLQPPPEEGRLMNPMNTDNTHKSDLQASPAQRADSRPFRGEMAVAREGLGRLEVASASVYTADVTHYGMLKSWARSNRTEMTNAEEALWSQIKDNELGVRFRRQHIIGNYIVDFICIKLHLIIEVDGEYHHTENKQLLDKLRDESLQDKGYTILRFSNEEVIGDVDFVVARIQEQINKLKSPTQPQSPTQPSPKEGGLINPIDMDTN